ncbi:MAG: GxGYxYP family putative glycoside hydrolase [Candidatus Sumerlaeota bacterium]|nr:GxGYxYP family putative glycoside hydrolase [Candidatus Sumerlaeota bacterium]
MRNNSFPFLRSIVCAGGVLAVAASVPGASVFPPGAPPADEVSVVDLTGATANQRITAAILQGIVNRGPDAKVYLLLGEWAPFWIDRMAEKGYVRHRREMGFRECVAAYGDCFDAVIVWDPAVPATINVATMMSSLRPAIACAPEDLDLFRKGRRVEDLRGRWKTNVQAYEWAFENLWPRMNHQALCHCQPSLAHLRDYLVAHRIFACWVSGKEREDGVVSRQAEELDFLRRLLAASPANIPILGFWAGPSDESIHEYVGVGLAGEYGKFTVPSNFAPNLSFFSGVRTNLDSSIAAYRSRIRFEVPKLESDKAYICFDVTESGDAVSYWQSRQHKVWADADRGKIPINWAMGPTLLELSPPVAEYFFEQATANDYLYVGLSGIGYTHPYRAMMSRVADPEAAWDEYARLTGEAMDRMGCREIGLYTESNRVFDRGVCDPISLRFVNAIPGLGALILGMHRDKDMNPDDATYLLDGGRVVVSHVMTRWPRNYRTMSRDELVRWQVEEIRSHTPSRRPAFMHVMNLSWAYEPSLIREVRESLGAEYVPLNAREFADLFRASHP